MELTLEQIAKNLVARGKGILAADESATTCQKRFDSVGIECTEDTRREYRNLLFTTPGAADFMSGVILYDETFWQKTSDQPIPEYLKSQGIIPGIKVDQGLVDLPDSPGEKVTQGLDGLDGRMTKYFESGARFSKWRAVITIGDGTPTVNAIKTNVDVLARYAKISQAAGIVPIVEPEVMFDGTHSIQKCEEVMAQTYDALFQALKEQEVNLKGVILKTSMVLPGKNSGVEMNHDDIATRTVKVLHEHIPSDLGGVVFLSGGQTRNDAFINLNRIAKLGPHPWGVTFSFSRALQDPVLKLWAKDRNATKEIQDLFHNQLQLVSAASMGELDETKLEDDAFVTKSQDL